MWAAGWLKVLTSLRRVNIALPFHGCFLSECLSALPSHFLLPSATILLRGHRVQDWLFPSSPQPLPLPIMILSER